MGLRERMRRMPVAQRVVWLIIAACELAVVLSVIILIVADARAFRAALRSDLETTAAMVASTTQAALAFADNEFATQGLSALAAKPTILSACLYRGESGLMAAYQPRSYPTPPDLPPVFGRACPSSAPHEASETSASMSVVQPMAFGGSLYLVADLAPLRERYWWYGGLTTLVIVVGGLIGTLMTRRVHGLLAEAAAGARLPEALPSTAEDISCSRRVRLQRRCHLSVRFRSSSGYCPGAIASR